MKIVTTNANTTTCAGAKLSSAAPARPGKPVAAALSAAPAAASASARVQAGTVLSASLAAKLTPAALAASAPPAMALPAAARAAGAAGGAVTSAAKPTASPAASSTAKASADRPAPAAVSSPASGGIITTGGRVTVDIAASDSGYENRIYWSSDNFATRHLLGVDNHVATFDLGEFAAGTRIDFGIVNGNNQFFRTGGASANTDGVDHTRSSTDARGTQIGFEDLQGGGDRDFNDAVIRVRQSGAGAASVTAAPMAAVPGDRKTVLSVLPGAAGVGQSKGQHDGRPPTATAPQAPPPQAAAPKPGRKDAAPGGKADPVATPAPKVTLPPTVVLSPPKANAPAPAVAAPKPAPLPATPAPPGNRSGLGDGTNPGKAVGNTRSSNTGTLNPAKAAAQTVATPASAPAPVPVAAKTAAASAMAQAAASAASSAKFETNKQLLASQYLALTPAPAPVPVPATPARVTAASATPKSH